MNKEEALAKLPNQIVLAWTASWGQYIGVCKEVVSEPRRPWRAKVEILAPHELPYGDRTPFQKGKILNVGNNNAVLFDGEVLEYSTALSTLFSSKIAKYRSTYTSDSQSWAAICSEPNRFDIDNYAHRGLRKTRFRWIQESICEHWIGYQSRFIDEGKHQYIKCLEKGLLEQSLPDVEQFYSDDLPAIKQWIAIVQSTDTGDVVRV